MAANEGTAVAKKPSTKTHPTYLEMAKEAITSLSDKKGSTVPSIQSYIAGKYAIDGDTVRIHLKPALAKGLENGTLARPKNSDAKGYTGRFKVDKAKATNEEKEKEKKKKLKEKEAKEKVCLQITVIHFYAIYFQGCFPLNFTDFTSRL
jgi:histone H1/5